MSNSVHVAPLPAAALLGEYVRRDAYTDCYTAAAAGHITLSAYVQAFYTTPLFKLERLIIRAVTGIASTDAEAAELGAGPQQEFAAWRVEQREEQQLLLCDLNARTRSWLMVVPGSGSTQLYFGSAIVRDVDPESGDRSLSIGFRLLLGFHKLYSRLLLRAALRRLAK